MFRAAMASNIWRAGRVNAPAAMAFTFWRARWVNTSGVAMASTFGGVIVPVRQGKLCFDVWMGELRFPMRLFFVLLLLATVACAPAQVRPAGGASMDSKPIEIKVVVIAMFEVGADTGDTPGEYQFWVEREHLDTVLPFPQGYRDLRMNKDGVLAVLTGVGTARAAATIMALGTDPRFDLTHAYFLVAGIGGIDPQVGSLGSAVWSDYIVDGDLAHEIDAREIPKDWPTGYVPLGKSTPYEQPRAARFGDDGNVYRLNPALVDWAFNLTNNIALPDTPGMAERRMQFEGAAGHRPPFVLRGDNLSASTFWHGKLLNQWARDWVKYQTDGKGTYAICGMEDTGTLQSLTWLAKAKRVDINRVLVLRTASNYDQQRTGLTAAESLADTKVLKYSAYMPALEDAYMVGHVVVDRIVADWRQDREQIPAVAARQ
jgi:purine nucleoside permease